MRRLQEVKPRITDLTLSEPLEEFLAIFCDELGGQLDRLVVDIGELWVLHLVLVSRWRLYCGLLSGLELRIAE